MDASRNTDDLGAWRTIENPVAGVWLTVKVSEQEEQGQDKESGGGGK